MSITRLPVSLIKCTYLFLDLFLSWQKYLTVFRSHHQRIKLCQQQILETTAVIINEGFCMTKLLFKIENLWVLTITTITLNKLITTSFIAGQSEVLVLSQMTVNNRMCLRPCGDYLFLCDPNHSSSSSRYNANSVRSLLWRFKKFTC